MYAIILAGGKQYKVKAGDVVKVEKIESGVGEAVSFDKVLMLIDGDNVKLGTPYLDGEVVKGEIVEQGRHKKVHIIKFRRRKHSMKHMGHRQYYTAVSITEVAGKKAAATTAKATVATKKEAPATEKAVAAKPKTAKAAVEQTTTAAKKPAAKVATSAAKKPVAKKATTAAAKKPAAKKPAKKQ